MKSPAEFFCNRFFSDRYFFCYGPGIVEDQTFYGAIFNSKSRAEAQIALLNSTFGYLFIALMGRVALGEGVLQYAVYEMTGLPVLNVQGFAEDTVKKITGVFQSISARKVYPVHEELTQNDRRDLDMIIAGAVGLSQNDVDDLYEDVIKLTDERGEKAGSV